MVSAGTVYAHNGTVDAVTIGQKDEGFSTPAAGIKFGNGGGDTNLYRSGANSLATDDAFTVAGLLTANGNILLQTGDTFTINGDAFTDLTGAGLTISTGQLTVDSSVLDDSFFIQGGYSCGTAAIFGTNDKQNLQFETNGSTVATLTTAGQLQMSVQGPSGGILLGGDANLYRGYSGQLNTDGQFVVGQHARQLQHHLHCL